MKLNLPNKLTVLRIFLVPVFMVVMICPIIKDDFTCRIVSAVIFILTSLTDMLDGKIARKYNLITNLGKFLDPVADKMLIIGSYIALIVAHRDNAVYSNIAFWCVFVIFVRELGVTSLRAMVMGKVDVAANIWGKLKTVSQMLCVIVAIIEPLFIEITKINTYFIGSYALLIFSSLMALISGIKYLLAYMPFLTGDIK